MEVVVTIQSPLVLFSNLLVLFNRDNLDVLYASTFVSDHMVWYTIQLKGWQERCGENCQRVTGASSIHPTCATWGRHASLTRVDEQGTPNLADKLVANDSFVVEGGASDEPGLRNVVKNGCGDHHGHRTRNVKMMRVALGGRCMGHRPSAAT
ncbi:hypothetical protein KI387_018399, partial [Taxus chinensis]